MDWLAQNGCGCWCSRRLSGCICSAMEDMEVTVAGATNARQTENNRARIGHKVINTEEE